MRLIAQQSSPTAASRVAGMPVRRLGAGLGLLRCAIGAVMIGDPPQLARLLGVDAVTARQTSWLTMMIGGREIGLGAGSLSALRSGHTGRTWYAAQAVTDAGDTLALITAVRAGRISQPLGAAVAVFALAGVGLNLAAMRAAGPE